MSSGVEPGWNAVPVPKVTGRAKASTGHRQFDKLLARLKTQRKEIARWQLFKQVYQERLSTEYQPLSRRLREKRIDTAKLLDHALQRKALKKRERDKVWETLSGLLLTLLAEEEDPALIELHDKYADLSYGEQRRRKMESLRASGKDELGVDTDAYDGGESPEELADWIAEQARAVAAEPPPAPVEPEKSARATAREEREARVIEGGVRSMREVFRKLVSAHHPDRETDPEARTRKTELMQEINKAYKSGDLFTLLEMQRRIERADAVTTAGVTDERLRQYAHVLERQSQRLRAEFAALIQPFELVVGDAVTRKITPDDVRRALDVDIVDLKSVLRTVEQDLAQFQAILQLKPVLKNQPFDPKDPEPWVMPEEGRRFYRGRRR